MPIALIVVGMAWLLDEAQSCFREVSCCGVQSGCRRVALRLVDGITTLWSFDADRNTGYGLIADTAAPLMVLLGPAVAGAFAVHSGAARARLTKDGEPP